MPETRKTKTGGGKNSNGQPTTPGTPTRTPTRRTDALLNTPRTVNTPMDTNMGTLDATERDNDLSLDTVMTLIKDMKKEIDQLKMNNNDQQATIKKLSSQVCTLEHKLEQLDNHADLTEAKLSDLDNTNKELNLKFDGIKETNDENAKELVLELARSIGARSDPDNIITAYRLGRNQVGGRPRTIFAKFKTMEARNEIYFKRAKLGNDTNKHMNIWINDDITPYTARQREGLRSIADLCKAKGEEQVKLHGDGIVIQNKKYYTNNIDKLPSDLSLTRAKTVTRQNHVYFQSAASPLSNLYRCDLEVFGKPFTSAEQAFQWRKAQVANDTNAQEMIWKARDPYTQKKIGAQINSNQNWDDIKIAVLEEISWAKYNQNADLKNVIMNTGECKLVEATKDPYWGCGAIITAQATKQHTWRGQNITGATLAKIRTQLRATT